MLDKLKKELLEGLPKKARTKQYPGEEAGFFNAGKDEGKNETLIKCRKHIESVFSRVRVDREELAGLILVLSKLEWVKVEEK